MGISAPFDTPFYQGAQVAADTPYYLPVSIGARSYLIDLKKYQRRTIPPIRPPQDSSAEPGEQSLNQEGLWRRSQQSFHLGTGQEYFDDSDSVRQRYWSSKGINPWTRKHLTLLNGTESKRTSSGTNLRVLLVGTRLYIVDGSELRFTADPTPSSPTFTDSTAGGSAIASVTTDGAKVWAAVGTTGIRETVAGSTSATTLIAGTYTLVGYVNGRLLAANANVLYEISRAGVATTIWTHPNPSFAWNVIAGAPNAAYLGGISADRTDIYAVTTLDATGALAPPILAASLPDGETLNSIEHYAGVLLLATSRGLRLASIGSNNSIQHGPVIQITNGVSATEGQGEFVWFSWTNYDTVSTGLGRANLATFTDDLVPAYSTDLMATTQGTVTSIASFGGRRYFAVSGVGFYGETAALVASGVINTGRIRYGTTEKKAATSLDLRHDPLPIGAGIQASVVTEEGSSTNVGSSDVPASLSPTSPLSMTVQRTEAVQVVLTLSRTGRTVTDGVLNTTTTVTSATAAFTASDVGRTIAGVGIPIGTTIASVTNATTVLLSVAATATASGVTLNILGLGPSLNRWTLYSRVTPVLSDEIIVPLIIHDNVLTELGEGQKVFYDTLEHYLFLKNLADTKALQVYQEGSTAWTVYVSEVEVQPEDWNQDNSFFNGTIPVRLITVSVV